MSIHSPHQIPEIAIYETNGSCQILTQIAFKELAAQSENPLFHISLVTPKEIRYGYLQQPHVVGLVMPGRNKGFDYRTELGDDGIQQINVAVDQGLHLHATCAASAILMTETRWNNPFQTGDHNIIKSKWGLLKGYAEGLIMDLCDDPYLIGSASEKADLDSDKRIPATVVTVKDLRASAIKPMMDIVYNGGCRFYPDDNKQVTPLLLHQQTSDQAYAALSFMHGAGRCEFLNVHAETPARQFKYVFKKAEKAIRQADVFKQNIQSLKDSHDGHLSLFRDFAQGCVDNGKTMIKQPLLIIAMPGLKQITALQVNP